jgi:hypothetical protein
MVKVIKYIFQQKLNLYLKKNELNKNKENFNMFLFYSFYFINKIKLFSKLQL